MRVHYLQPSLLGDFRDDRGGTELLRALLSVVGVPLVTSRYCIYSWQGLELSLY